MSCGQVGGRYLAAALFLAAVAGCTTAGLKEAAHKTAQTGVAIKDKAVEQGSALAADTAAHGKVVATTASKAMRKGFADLTPQEEYFIGRAVAARILGIYRPVENPAATRYLNAIGLAVAQASTGPETFGGWHLVLLDSDEVNAFAAPGGFIFVTRGLYKSCRTEEQLATVVALSLIHI